MSSVLEIIPLGGIGEFGMNCMAVRYEDEMLILDAGMGFDHVLPPPDGDDLPVVDRDRSVLDRSGGHGEEMFGRIHDHSRADYTRRKRPSAAC